MNNHGNCRISSGKLKNTELLLITVIIFVFRVFYVSTLLIYRVCIYLFIFLFEYAFIEFNIFTAVAKYWTIADRGQGE